METKAYTLVPAGRRWFRWTCRCGATDVACSRRLAAGGWREHAWGAACPARIPAVAVHAG